MKGILKTLVLLAVPICLIGMMGCGQNLQSSLAENSGIWQDEKTILETNEDAELAIAEDKNEYVINAEDGVLWCNDDWTIETIFDVWDDIEDEEPSNIISVYSRSVSYRYAEEICSGACVENLCYLIITFESKCAGQILSTMVHKACHDMYPPCL